MSRSFREVLPHAAQFALSGLGIATALTGILGGVIFYITSLAGRANAKQMLLLLASLLWMALLTAVLNLPSLVISFMNLLGRPLARWEFDRFRIASLALLLWPVVVLVGNLLTGAKLNWLFLPPLQILAVALPLWWLVEFGRRGLPRTSARRDWGLVSVASLITPTLIMLVEIGVLVALFIAWVAWLSSQPARAQELSVLAQRLTMARTDAAAVQRILLPYLQSPLVIGIVLIIASVVIPLIEELFKPLGVWALARSSFTPAEGLSAGLISGAMFALFESLGFLSNAAGNWLPTVVGRLGTGILHTVCAGLLGYGLACAWNKSGYFTLAGMYLAAAAIHGTWNFFGLAMGAVSLLQNPDGVGQTAARTLGIGAPYILGGLALLLLGLLWNLNRKLRPALQPPANPIPAEEGGYN